MGTQGGPQGHHGSIWPEWHQNKPFALMLLLIGSFVVVFLMAKIDQMQAETAQIGLPYPSEHTITIDGEGKVVGKPDIATITVGVDSKAIDVATAQVSNTTTVNAMLAAIKALGVSADDVQTASYNVYENTTWNPDAQTYDSDGWVVSQSLTIKVRDTSKVASVLSVAGQNGATNVYGPSFTIDDPSDLKAEARQMAVADAAEKAAQLAATLGVRLGGVVSYSEYSGGTPYPYDYAMYDKAYGGESSAPTIEPGTNEIDLTVSVTYRILD